MIQLLDHRLDQHAPGLVSERLSERNGICMGQAVDQGRLRRWTGRSATRSSSL